MASISAIYSENRLVVLKLVFFSILMILVPLLVFGVMYFAMFDQDQSKLGLCGLGAVVSVNAVIISYVLMAWNEKVAEPVSPKND